MLTPVAPSPAKSRTTSAALTAVPSVGVFRIPDGTVRGVILAHVRDLLRQVRARYVKKTVPIDGDYRQLRAASLPEALPLGGTYDLLVAESQQLLNDYPDLSGELESAISALSTVLDMTAGIARLWAVYSAVIDALADVLRLDPDSAACVVAPVEDALEVRLTLDPTRLPAEHRGRTGDPWVELAAPAYLAWTGELSGATRRARRRPSRHQIVAEQFAFDSLVRGHRGAGPVRSYGTSGFRDHQTYMSVTDPGEGHLDGTTRDPGHLDGVIVHIEHLERGSFQDRSYIEPYRIPHPHTVARVRHLVGTDAPTSSYVGRPVFEGAVEPSMLKAAHTVAAACSALFAEGLSECKLAIEGMTVRQAIQFMRVVRAAVRRDRFTQVLSAAFNLNTPILDDRAGQLYDAEQVCGRLDIGLLGVEIARAGGFDKVTWDGTADSYPSRCVLEQISYAEALTLVHRAHEAGLLTYFSAGFRLHNLAQAVYTGVDGVGVGGAQILRYMDAGTGYHGPFLEENIREILAERDQAETALLGRAALALSRLDRMAFEGSLTALDDARRRDLFDALPAGRHNLETIRHLLNAVAHVTAAPADTDHPLVCWVRRLRRAGHRSLAAEAYDWPQWKRHLDRLTEAAERGDLDRLDLMLSSLVREPAIARQPAGTPSRTEPRAA